MKKTDKPVLIEEVYDAELESVWSALTAHNEMIQWYFRHIPEFEPEVGFMTTFEVPVTNSIFTHQWEVTHVIHNKMISYNWNYAEHPGDGRVTFDLESRGNQTILRFTMEVLEDFSDDILEFRRESCITGWNYFLKERLKDYLQLVSVA